MQGEAHDRIPTECEPKFPSFLIYATSSIEIRWACHYGAVEDLRLENHFVLA